MIYQWESSLETGYQKVDNQHKQLFAALNDLISANLDGKGEDEIFKTLDFLSGYTVMHFSDEEKLMRNYDYPDYYVHRRIHEDFKQTVGNLVKKLHDEGTNKELVGEVTDAVGDWLLNHIKGDDFRMAAFVQAREEAENQQNLL